MCSETERVRWDRCVVKQKGCSVVEQKGSGGIGV